MNAVRHRHIACTGANEVRLVADAYGQPSDPPVLLLHGGGQTRHSWGGTAAALAAAGFYAVSADLRGHGESDWDPTGDYSMAVMRHDMERWCDLLSAAGHGVPAVVGASMGGITGFWTEGARAEEGLPPASRALVLVDIAHRSEAEGIKRIIDFMTGRPEGFGSLDEVADAVAQYLPHRPRPTNLDGLARNLRRSDDGRYHWHWDPAFMSEDRRPKTTTHIDIFVEHARRLTLPVLLVRGRMSDVVSEETAQEFLELVPHAEYVDVRDAHHMVAGDRNDAFTAPVVDFLRRVAS
ncbi:MAG TPA: alpha/beta hydrolase [Acidimicrobiaceae bacterium]|nr:alpha/beta hydrolase [Acidimicrobiaceae bacterium]